MWLVIGARLRLTLYNQALCWELLIHLPWGIPSKVRALWNKAVRHIAWYILSLHTITTWVAIVPSPSTVTPIASILQLHALPLVGTRGGWARIHATRPVYTIVMINLCTINMTNLLAVPHTGLLTGKGSPSYTPSHTHTPGNLHTNMQLIGRNARVEIHSGMLCW